MTTSNGSKHELRGHVIALIFADIINVTAKEDAGVEASVAFSYVNWKGVRSRRYVKPMRVFFGATAQHPEPQWFVTALDIKKDQQRDFACGDITYPEGFEVVWSDTP